jgi:hypothetical protein
MRAWVQDNPGGLKKDFDMWYRGLSAQERQVSLCTTSQMLSAQIFYTLQPFTEAAKTVSLFRLYLIKWPLMLPPEQEGEGEIK